MTVTGKPFDRVQCPTATLGTGNVVVTDPSPGYMRPYDAGVHNGDPITVILEEDNNFELVETTALNCTPQSCVFTRDAVRYSSIDGVVSQAKLSLKGGARVSVVAGAADLAVHHGGTINGDIIVNGDLAVNGTLTGGNLPVSQGPPGPQGPVGAAGPQGLAGAQGPAGADGTQGPIGSTGPQGAPGPDGPQGVMGPAGPAGPAGAQGTTGPQGAPGPSSDTWGFTYNNNPAEPPASQQFRFDNANTHVASKIWISNLDLDGVDVANYLALIGINDELYTQDKNDSTTYDVFTVTAPPVNKGAYTEVAISFARGSATTVVSNQAAIISLMRKGSVGAQGPQGPIGQDGLVGPQGPQGIQGQAGPQGNVGPQGPAGADGTQGPAGLQGATGPQGAQGPIGLTGAQGPKGDKGDAGTPGTVGATGAVGATGPAGAQGATGATGPQGATGAQGPAGPSAVSANAGNVAKLGTDNLILVPDTAPTRGTVAADNAATGFVGEQLATSQTTAVNLTTNVTANIATLALTPGDWVVAGVVIFTPAQGPSKLGAAVGTTSATLPTAAQIAAGAGNMTQYGLSFGNGLVQTMQSGPTRVNVSANTNVFLTAQGTFNSTCTATGYISARRVR